MVLMCAVLPLSQGTVRSDAVVERKVENLDDDGDVLLLLTTTTNNIDVVGVDIENTHCEYPCSFSSPILLCFIYLQQLLLQFVLCFC